MRASAALVAAAVLLIVLVLLYLDAAVCAMCSYWRCSNSSQRA